MTCITFWGWLYPHQQIEYHYSDRHCYCFFNLATEVVIKHAVLWVLNLSTKSWCLLYLLTWGLIPDIILSQRQHTHQYNDIQNWNLHTKSSISSQMWETVKLSMGYLSSLLQTLCCWWIQSQEDGLCDAGTKTSQVITASHCASWKHSQQHEIQYHSIWGRAKNKAQETK